MSYSETIFKPYPIPYPAILPVTPISGNRVAGEISTNASASTESEEDSILSTTTTPASIKRINKFLTPLKPFKPPTFINKSAQNKNQILRPPISKVTLNLPKLPNLFSPITPSTSNKTLNPSPSTLNRSTSKKRHSNDQILSNNSKKPKRLPFSPPTFLATSSPSFLSSFHSNSNSSNSARGSGGTGGNKSQIPSIELTTLERRLILLKQARKYQEAEFEDSNYRDEDGLSTKSSGFGKGGGGGGGLNSERKLRELNKKWKEVGKAAIELLWDHATSLTDPSNDSNPFFSTSNSFLNNSSTKSWGFSSPPSSSPSSSAFNNNNNGISTSWGWSTSSNSFSSEETPTLHSNPSKLFLLQIEEESRESGRTQDEILDELIKKGDDDDLKDLIDVDTFWEGMSKKIIKKVKKVVKEDEDEEEEEEEEEEDQLMRELEESCRGLSDGVSSSREVDDIDMEEARNDFDDEESDDKKDKEKEKVEGEDKMNLGKFMRNIVGVDPNLFGWNDEQEEFI